MIKALVRPAGRAFLKIVFEVVSSAVTVVMLKSEEVFKKCKTCRYVNQEKNKAGLQLVLILGHAAGNREGNKYSKPELSSGVVENERKLVTNLKAPMKHVKGTKMAFVSLQKMAFVSLQRTIQSQIFLLFASVLLPLPVIFPGFTTTIAGANAGINITWSPSKITKSAMI